jgi:hypothetical protein
MSRDSGGTMALAKPPFVAGTASSAPDVNAVLADIATELTDSLSRSGKGGLLAQLKMNDGSLVLPGVTFTSEPSSGWYRIAAGVLGLVILGVERLRATATGVKVTGALEATGVLNAAAGISAHATYQPIGAGELITAISATTGVVRFGNPAQSRSLSFDGTYYQLPGSETQGVTPTQAASFATKGYVDARFVVAARINGSTGAIISQTGTGTLVFSAKGTGAYDYTLAGLTTNAIVLATAEGINVTIAPILNAGTLGIVTYVASTTVQADPSYLSILVLKL